MEETEASKSKSVEMHLFINSLKKKNLLERNHSLPIVSPSGWLVLHVHAFYGKDKKIFKNFCHVRVKIQLSTFPEIKEKENTHAIS